MLFRLSFVYPSSPVLYTLIREVVFTRFLNLDVEIREPC